MLIDINKIIVNDRIRKDFGNLEELAEDIKENTLLNALVVSPNSDGTYTLIAGERRLRAMRDILGYTQVTVNTVGARDDEHALLMEISENECRKEFTKTERLDYARRLARIESAKAKERMSEGGKGTQNIAGLGETRTKVAQALGTNRETIRQEQYIEDNRDLLDPADFAEWDEGKLSTNKAFQRIKAAMAQAERERDEARKDAEEVSELYGKVIVQRDEAKENLASERAKNLELGSQIANLRHQVSEKPEPEVIEREVVPKDYEQLKRDVKALRHEAEMLNDSYQQVWREKLELDKRLAQANELLGERGKDRDVQRDVEYLTARINTLLHDHGGKVWAFDQLYRVDETTRHEFERAMVNLAAFAQNMTQMIATNQTKGALE